MDKSTLNRRPNPPGWVPPKSGSIYNPYDPTDKRPPQGYPSEFSTPGKMLPSNSIPLSASQYQNMKETMKRFQYSPEPMSELYPGQYKQLRRVYNYSKFYRGVELTSKLSIGAIIVYSLFIHRWNDGYENVFSNFYRAKLRLKYILLGNLSDQETEDLANTKFEKNSKLLNVQPDSFDIKDHENIEFALERPQRKHMISAQRIMQEREERLMRALDIAQSHSKLNSDEIRR
ncbi:hypothetical protein WICMUC_004103 [Wickerhamomyces mucosus]|uniref:Uncharacterized protein n=1 Tax=Wickerhamomyces mucosus TaxID=1378264 RepID=A0A9P8PIY8_9ASCO|nr:hypothetical protein WICMUC_004103 [Wickerhamomyces mucosus]